MQHIGLFWNVVINGLRGEAGTVEQALYDLVPTQCWAAFGHRELRSGAPPRLPLSVCNEICDSLSKALDERTRGAASGGGVASSAGASRDNDITELQDEERAPPSFTYDDFACMYDSDADSDSDAASALHGDDSESDTESDTASTLSSCVMSAQVSLGTDSTDVSS